ADRWSLSAANAARLVFPTSSISPNAYRPSIGENRARASDSVIHPRSPTGRALSDADSASSSTALSLRASGGVDVPGANAALMVFHIPMAGRYIAALQGTTPASLGSLDRDQRENKRNAARRPWSAHRFESRAYPNSSPMPKPIRVRSPWRRASAFVRPSHPP